MTISQPSHSLCLSHSFSPVWLLAQVQTQVKAELAFRTLLVILFLSYCEPHCCAAHNSSQGPEHLLTDLRFWQCLNLAGCSCIHSSKLLPFSASTVSKVHLSLLTSAFTPSKYNPFLHMQEASREELLQPWHGKPSTYPRRLVWYLSLDVFKQFLSLPTGECLTVFMQEVGHAPTPYRMYVTEMLQALLFTDHTRR